jgi:hypothetical protein
VGALGIAPTGIARILRRSIGLCHYLTPYFLLFTFYFLLFTCALRALTFYLREALIFSTFVA